jgi:hypothetical protein
MERRESEFDQYGVRASPMTRQLVEDGAINEALIRIAESQHRDQPP